MQSPDSGEELQPLAINGMTVYACKSTGGIWFPEDVLGAMRKTDEAGLEKLDQVTAPASPINLGAHPVDKCPLDGSDLMQYHFQETFDVKLEQCLQCGGIWVPHTELDKLVAIRPGTIAPPMKYNGPVSLEQRPENLAPEAAAAVAQLDTMAAQANGRAIAFQTFFNGLSRYSRSGIFF